MLYNPTQMPVWAALTQSSVLCWIQQVPAGWHSSAEEQNQLHPLQQETAEFCYRQSHTLISQPSITKVKQQHFLNQTPNSRKKGKKTPKHFTYLSQDLPSLLLACPKKTYSIISLTKPRSSRCGISSEGTGVNNASVSSSGHGNSS